MTSKISPSMALLVSIPIVIVSLYILVLALFIFGLTRIKNTGYKDSEGTVRVSIIIAFKNEEINLGDLVQDLLSQTYPASMFQVIFVDDHSDDDSREIVNSLVTGRAGFSCLALPMDKHGKKQALRHGIEHAEYEWIIQVDADCRIDNRFIASHIAFLEKHPSDLVAGLVTTGRQSNRFMESFERMDLLSLGGVGAASFFFKRPMMCSGANLAYSRELYRQTRSFDPSDSVASGDDMFIMIGARKLGKILTYNLAAESVVRTIPANSLFSYLKQRVRWGAKTTYYKMWDIQLLAILVVLTNAAVLLSPVWVLYAPHTWPWFLGIWMAKTVADGSLIYITSGYTRQKQNMMLYLLVSIAYYPVFLLIIIRSVFGQTGWKE